MQQQQGGSRVQGDEHRPQTHPIDRSKLLPLPAAFTPGQRSIDAALSAAAVAAPSAFPQPSLEGMQPSAVFGGEHAASGALGSFSAGLESQPSQLPRSKPQRPQPLEMKMQQSAQTIEQQQQQQQRYSGTPPGRAGRRLSEGGGGHHQVRVCMFTMPQSCVLPLELRPYAHQFITASGYPYFDPRQLQGGGVTTNFRTKPNPLLQYTATFPAASSLSHHAHPPPPSQHQRHHSNPQMQAASMGMYVAQAQGSGAAGMMPSTLGYGSAATMAPHPHPPHHPPQPQPMQLAPGQLSIPSAMQMTGPSSGGGGGGVLLPTFPLTDARRSMLHYAARRQRRTSAEHQSLSLPASRMPTPTHSGVSSSLLMMPGSQTDAVGSSAAMAASAIAAPGGAPVPLDYSNVMPPPLLIRPSTAPDARLPGPTLSHAQPSVPPAPPNSPALAHGQQLQGAGVGQVPQMHSTPRETGDEPHG